MSNLHQLSVKALSDGLQNKQFSSVELTQHFLDRIATHDKAVNSFITATPELALEHAKTADKLRADGDNHPFWACQWHTKTTFAPKAF